MKKIIALALVFLALIPCAFAESIDYSSMTAAQLREVIAQARAALASMEEPFADKCVIYDKDDVKITITGFRFDEKKSYLYISATVVNRSSNKINIKLEDAYVNGWQVKDQFLYIGDVESKKNAKAEMRLWDLEASAEVTSLEQIEDFAFQVKITDSSTFKTIDKADEQTITFAW